MHTASQSPIFPDLRATREDDPLVLELSQADLHCLRAALFATLGRDGGWSDDELREMAFATVHLLRVARRIARSAMPQPKGGSK